MEVAEAALLTSLSKLVTYFLDQVPDLNDKPETREAIARRLADTAWNGLLLLLRDALARHPSATLDGLGRFELRDDGAITFSPDASLLEASTALMETQDRHRRLGSQAAFYLLQALTLIDAMPKDVEINMAIGSSREPVQPSQAPSLRVTLSSVVVFAAKRLQQNIQRWGIEPNQQPMVSPAADVPFGWGAPLPPWLLELFQERQERRRPKA